MILSVDNPSTRLRFIDIRRKYYHYCKFLNHQRNIKITGCISIMYSRKLRGVSNGQAG